VKGLFHARRDRYTDSISSCGSVVNIGGDTLSHSSGNATTLAALDKLALFRRAGLKTAVLAHTLGIYRFPYSYPIRRLFRSVDLITVRERQSFEHMRKLGIVEVEHTADLAFLLEPSCYLGKKLRLDEFRPFACLVPSSMIYRKSFKDLKSVQSKREAYIETTRFMVDGALSEGVNILIVPHVYTDRYRDDLEALEIKSKLYRDDPRVRVIGEQYSGAEVKEIVGHAEFVISFRMHPCIAAASQGRPVFLATDSHKGAGVLSELQPERWILNLWQKPQRVVEAMIREHFPAFLSNVGSIEASITRERRARVRQQAARNIELFVRLIE
jgi:polysaccharide pyruvyl transferase WcaK-like protein